MNINPNNGDIFRQFKTIANQPVNSFQPAQTSSIQTKSEPKKNNSMVKIGLYIALTIAAIAGGYKLLRKFINPKTVQNVGDKAEHAIFKFKEFMVHAEEVKTLHARNKEKIDRAFVKGQGLNTDLLDLQYYKDAFRLNTTIPAERLKIVRETANPEIKAQFERTTQLFGIDDGILIHGSDRPEKRELFNYFISEAQKHDFDIIRIPGNGFEVLQTPYGEFKPKDAQSVYSQIDQAIAYLFPKAKDKFLKEKKCTMFVIENADNLMRIDNREIEAANSSLRGSINVHTHQCGRSGVCWLSTADDINNLDPSNTRGGRIKYRINIDKALQASSDLITDKQEETTKEPGNTEDIKS